MSTVIELAGDIHDQLLKAIDPATPGSIRASSLSPRRNKILFFIALSAAFSFILFISPVVLAAVLKFFEIDGRRFDNARDMKELAQIVGGAGLGASFYALYTASAYIEKATFEPRYGNTYLIRFLLGVLSGIILAYFLKDYVAAAAVSNPGLAKVGVAALALIGGYSQEAVSQILKRIADILVTAVAGSDKDKVDAAKQQAQADADKKAAQVTTDAAKKIQVMAGTAGTPPAVAAALTQLAVDMVARK